jgi:hypothetical protein
MNTIKKIVLFFALILIQNMLGAQTQNSHSAELIELKPITVQIENKMEPNELIIISNAVPIDPNFILKNDTVINSTTILYDPKTMDSKPE